MGTPLPVQHPGQDLDHHDSGSGQQRPSGDEHDAAVASGPGPGLLDLGQGDGVDVEADVAGGDLAEQAVVGGGGIAQGGRAADPAAEQLDGALRRVMAGRAATSPAAMPTWM